MGETSSILDLEEIELRWPKKMSASRGDDVHALIAEVRRLRERVAELEQENRILDRALGP